MPTQPLSQNADSWSRPKNHQQPPSKERFAFKLSQAKIYELEVRRDELRSRRDSADGTTGHDDVVHCECGWNHLEGDMVRLKALTLTMMISSLNALDVLCILRYLAAFAVLRLP